MTNAPKSGGVEPEQALTDPHISGSRSEPKTGRTRISTVWVGVIVVALVLVQLLIFILQNTRSVKISYLSASWNMPIGVALLFAAIGGLLLAGVVASLRIWQLRHRLARRSKPTGATARPDQSRPGKAA